MFGMDLPALCDVMPALSLPVTDFTTLKLVSVPNLRAKRLPAFILISVGYVGKSRSSSASCMSATGSSNCLSQ